MPVLAGLFSIGALLLNFIGCPYESSLCGCGFERDIPRIGGKADCPAPVAKGKRSLRGDELRAGLHGHGIFKPIFNRLSDDFP